MTDPGGLVAEAHRILDFARAARHPAGGFGALTSTGSLSAGAPRETYLTARMTHVFALGQRLGRADAAGLVEHGLAALAGPLRDRRHGGWFAAIDGAPDGSRKDAYTHAFVVLAAASAVAAGHDARALLDDALGVILERFWDDDAGAAVDRRSRDWAEVEPYRGANANMHLVEALLAAADATGDGAWRERAGRIADRLIGRVARDRGWRLPEHFDADWAVRADYNQGRPADPFRPYGVTIGHLLEWSRLVLHVRAAAAPDDPRAEQRLGWARALFDTAVREGWAVDGADGFVYTVDFDGRPVVRNRLHWVLAEAIAAAAALWRATGEEQYARWQARWWDHAEAAFIDRVDGSWRHELDPANRPTAQGTWPGKPDAYHAVQAALLPLLPLAPSIAFALGRIDGHSAFASTV